MFRRKPKTVVTTPPLAAKASPKTKAAIAFFNEKKSAVDLLEDTASKKFKPSGYTKTKYDAFFEHFESADFWGTVALIVTAAFMVAIIYWGFNQ